MWLEHINTLLEETNMDHLTGDLPMAIFMIKLLFSRIKFDNFTNNKLYLDYIRSQQFIELRYFIQYTIKEEIEEECVLKEKAMEDEIKELDEMFFKIPTYEDRMILYAKYIEGNDFNEAPATEWMEGNFDKSSSIAGLGPGTPWKLIEYYNYFKTCILNFKDAVDQEIMTNRRLYGKPNISVYRYNQVTILKILNRFSNKESFWELIKSIRDVKVSKLMENRDKDTLNY
tara:strand:+ start:447 stop:1133 length:687 start_codon:yes stop_codon:yes gene_type:complete